MTARRKPITDKMKWQALLYRFAVPCVICKVSLGPKAEIEWDHFWPIALGGPDSYQAIRPLHKACHAKKTFGTKATTAGSDIHKIAKDKRFAKGKMAVNKGAKKKLTAWSKRVRAWPKGRKMQSKGFVKI